MMVNVGREFTEKYGVIAYEDLYIWSITPSYILDSEEFKREMEKRGWELVEIEPVREVWFYEWGGMFQGADGEWYCETSGMSSIRVRDGEIIRDKKRFVGWW